MRCLRLTLVGLALCVAVEAGSPSAIWPAILASATACYIPARPVPSELVLSPRPSPTSLPANFDWRNVDGVSLVSNVLSQQAPEVCGSCWAEAATGALSDRYKIATNGSLQVNLAVQALLSFPKKITGGNCGGGDDLAAYEFIHKYGIADDTCLPFRGVQDEYEVGKHPTVQQVQDRLCRVCHWNGECKWEKHYPRYSADEYGSVRGEAAMMAEIYSRGPIACSLDSEPDAFNKYTGGVIASEMLPAPSTGVDHVVVLAGFGQDPGTRLKYWVGRNSYGSRWGEGVAGGWFRLQRGNNTLFVEQGGCSWAVPAAADVQRAMARYRPAPSKAPH